MLYLFDFDGTIADTQPGVANSLRYAFETLGYACPPYEMMRVFLGPPLSEPMRELMHMPEEDIQKAIALFREPYNAGQKFNCSVIPGMFEVLHALKSAGHTVAIVSAKPEPFVMEITEHLGIRGMFDLIAGANMEEKDDGKKENIVRAMQICGYTNRPQEVVMIGDRRYDIEAARQCGIRSIGVLFGFGSRDELEMAGADTLAETPQSLAQMLLRMGTQKPVSKGKKFWEIIYPVLIFLGSSLLVSFIGGAILGFIKVAIEGQGLSEVVQSVSSSALVMTLFSSILVILVLTLIRHYDDRRFGVEASRWNPGKILLGAALAAVFAILGNILLGLSHLNELFPGYENLTEIAFKNQNPIILALTTVFLGPIAEELTFRGLTQRRAVKYTNPVIGILIASVLFGAVHMNMVQFIYATPLGILLGFLYYKSNNLLVPILGHVLANGIVVAVMGFG